MIIDGLTIGEIKELAEIFGKSATSPRAHPMAGRYCIVRCRDAGVWAGQVYSVSGREVHLLAARRLYYWKVAGDKEMTLSGVARCGLDASSRVQGPVEVFLSEACEVIPCSDEAAHSIREAKVDERG